MRMVPLGEILAPAKTLLAGQRDIPLLSMTMHGGLVRPEEKFKKRVASEDTSGYKVVSKGQLVVGFPIDEGVLSFQRIFPEAIVSPAYGIWNLINPSCDWKFLERFLRSPQAIRYYGGKLRSTTARRRSLDRESFLELPVPLPPFSEQKRIAAILDQADALRRLRARALKKVNALAQAIFQEMFGARLAEIPSAPLSSLLAGISSGASPKCGDRPAREGEKGVLKLSAVTGGTFNEEENKVYEAQIPLRGKHRIRSGDLLFTRKNTQDLVAAVAIATESEAELYMPDLIFRLDLNRDAKINTQYLHAVLSYPKKRKEIQLMAGGAAGSMPNISKAKLLTVAIPLPPLPIQEEFSRRVSAAEANIYTTQKALDEANSLFASLQHRAFRGEL